MIYNNIIKLEVAQVRSRAKGGRVWMHILGNVDIVAPFIYPMRLEGEINMTADRCR